MSEEEKQAVLAKTRIFVREAMAGNDAAHDYAHIQRVMHTAQIIADTFTKCDRFYLEMLVLLHDVSDQKLASAKRYSTCDFLAALALDDGMRLRLWQGVQAISYSKNHDRTQPADDEVLIVRDADRLDALGAVGVARAFLYSGAHGHSIYGEEEKEKTTLHHFQDKLLHLSAYIVTEKGKELAVKRQAFLNAFYEELCGEIEGSASSC